jgi:nicotinamidase-related amidase
MTSLTKISRLTVPKIHSTALLICDIQEVFRPIIHGMASLIKTSEFLLASATALNVPVVVTEQYPKAMKHTVHELSTIWKEAEASTTTSTSSSSTSSSSSSGRPPTPTAVFAKTQFSMCTPEVTQHLSALGVESVILCGIETHICVMQTALDLLSQGIQVHVPVDAVSSCRSFDRTVALKRLESSGATISTSESLIFQLMQDSNHPQFRSISKLIKEHGTFSRQHELSHL